MPRWSRRGQRAFVRRSPSEARVARVSAPPARDGAAMYSSPSFARHRVVVARARATTTRECVEAARTRAARRRASRGLDARARDATTAGGRGWARDILSDRFDARGVPMELCVCARVTITSTTRGGLLAPWRKWLYTEIAYNSCAERARRTADQGGRDASRNRSIGITAIAITFRRIQSTRTPR